MYSNGCFISRSFSILRQVHSSYNHFNSKVQALVQGGLYVEALESYVREPIFPLHTSKFTFPSLLKACTSLSHLHYGKALQSTAIKMGLQFEPYVAASLLHMYVKCGGFGDALKLFDYMSDCETLVQDVALWNSVIDGFIKRGFFEESLDQFRRMQALNIKPDGYTVCTLLGALSAPHGQEIHAYVLRNAFENDAFVITAIVDMYSDSNRPLDAWNVFQSLENRRVIAAWNAMINGFCENGFWINAIELYSVAKDDGLALASSTFSSALKACIKGECIDCGRQLHCDVVKAGFENDPYVSTSLLTLYSRRGFLEESERIFDLTVDKKVEMWNSMISAYVSCGFPGNALEIYQKMHLITRPDHFAVSNASLACSMIGSCDFGRMVHGELIKRPIKGNVAVQSALLTMYSKLRTLVDADKVFEEIKEKDVVAWGSMISASCENKEFNKALDLYKAMEFNGVQLDSNIIASVVVACVGVGDGNLGCCFHGMAIKKGMDSDAFIGSSLIDFYSKLGRPELAKRAFLSISQKNLVLWNSLIMSYSENGLPDVSISLLPQSLSYGLHLDSVSVTCALAAVSQMAALLKGKVIHCYYIRFQITKEIQVENALIDMYIKCGCFSYAEHVFRSMLERSLLTWNIMISGYGSHGECHKAIELYHEMRNSGTAPDGITFLSLISSCNHCGLVNEGLHLFQCMRELNIEPQIQHYVNIVDLLGRNGCLEDARAFVENMSIAPDRGIWLSLLSACRVHRSVELGEWAAQNLIEMDPTRGSNYAQLLNLYVEAGLPEKAANLRAWMKGEGLKKLPGCSWIEGKNMVDVFFSGDSSSPHSVEIYGTLDSIRNNMNRKGCSDEVIQIMCESG